MIYHPYLFHGSIHHKCLKAVKQSSFLISLLKWIISWAPWIVITSTNRWEVCVLQFDLAHREHMLRKVVLIRSYRNRNLINDVSPCWVTKYPNSSRQNSILADSAHSPCKPRPLQLDREQWVTYTFAAKVSIEKALLTMINKGGGSIMGQQRLFTNCYLFEIISGYNDQYILWFCPPHEKSCQITTVSLYEMATILAHYSSHLIRQKIHEFVTQCERCILRRWLSCPNIDSYNRDRINRG